MTTSFDTDSETGTLEAFLQKSSHGALSKIDDLDDLRNRAEVLLKRITSPVRTMIAGEFSAGKSTLTNLLVGERLIPTSVLASALPPIVFRHGAKVTASACWWTGREPQAFAGADFDALMTVNPDYVVMTAPNPILKRVSIFDTPGTSDPDRESEVLIELSSRAEMIIWCTNAVQAWRESERHMWTQLSPAVTKNGLMAVTHVDLPSVRQGYGRIMARLVKEAGSLFHAILPIDSLTAIESAPRGVVADEAGWTNSGGAGLVKGVLDLAASLRAPDILAARDLIAKRLLPAMNPKQTSPKAMPKSEPLVEADVTEAPPAAEQPPENAVQERSTARPAATGGVKMNPLAGLTRLKDKTRAAAAESAAREDAANLSELAAVPQEEQTGATAAPPARTAVPAPHRTRTGTHALVTDWQSKMDALLLLVQGQNDPEESGFMQAASDTIMEVLDGISAAGVVQPEGQWLVDQFQEALDTVILMQMEPGDEAMEDAAMLLLQMSRDLVRIADSIE
jgi:hypothetical protein